MLPLAARSLASRSVTADPGGFDMSVRQCSACGSTNPEGADHCANCGSALRRVAATPSRPGTPPAVPRDAAPQPRTDDGVIRGKVRGFQRDSVSIGSGFTNIVWTFLVDQFNAAGDVVDTVQVQMQAPRFDGAIGDNDDVEIRAPRNSPRPLTVTELYNVSRRHVVKQARHPATYLGYVLLGVVGIAMAAVVATWAGFALPLLSSGSSSKIGTVSDMIETPLSGCVLTVENELAARVTVAPEVGSPTLAQLSRGQRVEADVRRQIGALTFYGVKTGGDRGWISTLGIRVSRGC